MFRAMLVLVFVLATNEVADARESGCSPADINSLPDVPEEYEIDDSLTQYIGFFVYVPVCMTNINRQVEHIDLDCRATHMDNTQIASETIMIWRQGDGEEEPASRDVDALVRVDFQNDIANPLLIERIECFATFDTPYQRFTDWDTVDYCAVDVSDAETVCARPGTTRRRVSNWIRGVE
ncbi:hypothetical protein [Hyphobacterium marinum]|uniref:Ig-like domain-containing protein n=1 Tax=Hyphobacterium marinum TaxID=3116574 RepID=A0ABU7LWB3_9PROT|nr:hypothetical protein [Hyphobacterium sp. Y6023]MEE2565275.1 hypothetical protein [Hyphobacterium sp. Y6023]